ncbi:MAG: PEP/pyruvate-binding domain-containing protein, partial [Azonexus sp.]
MQLRSNRLCSKNDGFIQITEREQNMTTQKFIYAFEEGDGKNKMLLGGKGANLCEMTQIGLNVPPGFTLTTNACLAYL